MKNIIRTFISISFLSVVVIVSTNAQGFGTRFEAEIPFDFTVGNKTFKAGSYDLSVVRSNLSVYSVSLFDKDGRNIYRTMALRNGSVAKKNSVFEFAVVGGEHFLESIKTPDIGYSLTRSSRNRAVAQAERVSVPTSAPQL